MKKGRVTFMIIMHFFQPRLQDLKVWKDSQLPNLHFLGITPMAGLCQSSTLEMVRWVGA